TSQLFKSLVTQLIHYYSNIINEETGMVLECLSDGAAAAESGSMRRFCIEGVVEFLKYSIKQRTKKEMAASPLSVDKLLTHAINLAVHPDKHRRLGGTSALNRSYRLLREETSL
ncbi:unnamed protein product, partial [Chrysoparadoxa australica]